MRSPHQFPGEPSLPGRVKQAGAHFVWLSENVAYGPNATIDPRRIRQVANHRANMLDTGYERDGRRDRRAQRRIVRRRRFLQSKVERPEVTQFESFLYLYGASYRACEERALSAVEGILARSEYALSG